MFHLSSNSKLRGIGYKALNVLRACNIVALLAVTVASWVMIVMTGIDGTFFFFDAITHIFVSSIAMFLILSEVQFGPLKRYFERSWPVFSDRHGFLWLGTAMVLLGCDMLANLNKSAYSSKNIGLPLWRLILAAGILSVTFGVFNFVATVVFRDGSAHLTARMIRADGNLADGGNLGMGVRSHDLKGYYPPPSRSGSSSSARYNPNKEDGMFSERSLSMTQQVRAPAPVADNTTAARFKRATQLFKNPFGNGSGGGASKLQIGKPIPVDTDDYMHTTDVGNVDIERAAAEAAASRSFADCESHYPDDRASPILPDVHRPPTALHPAMTGKATHYSTANMDQF